MRLICTSRAFRKVKRPNFMTNKRLMRAVFASHGGLPRISTYVAKHNQKKNGSDQARFRTSRVLNRNNVPCRALAISASSVPLCMSSAPTSALTSASTIRSMSAFMDLRNSEAISFCFKTKFSIPSSEQSHSRQLFHYARLGIIHAKKCERKSRVGADSHKEFPLHPQREGRERRARPELCRPKLKKEPSP